MSFVPVLPSHAVDPCAGLCDEGIRLHRLPDEDKGFGAHVKTCERCAAGVQYAVLGACERCPVDGYGMRRCWNYPPEPAP